MAVVALQKYFQNRACQLAALRGTKNEARLDPVENLDLYEWAFDAFCDPRFPTPAQPFDLIHKKFFSPDWGLGRGKPMSACWDSLTVFNAIKGGFHSYGRGGPLNLQTFVAGNRQNLETQLRTLRALKPNVGYPIMAVSKFLHVYNPELFPIYDTAMIWDKALNGTFRSEYQAFGQLRGIDRKIWSAEDKVEFLPWYMCFASDLLSAAYSDFMDEFANWLNGQPGANLSTRRIDPRKLYALAFELTILGAASL